MFDSGRGQEFDLQCRQAINTSLSAHGLIPDSSSPIKLVLQLTGRNTDTELAYTELSVRGYNPFDPQKPTVIRVYVIDVTYSIERDGEVLWSNSFVSHGVFPACG